MSTIIRRKYVKSESEMVQTTAIWIMSTFYGQVNNASHDHRQNIRSGK